MATTVTNLSDDPEP